MVTQVKREPLSLGYEGERWYTEIDSLGIPIPGFKRQIMITYEGNDFMVYHVKPLSNAAHNDVVWLRFDNLLMAAAYVRNFIDGYMEPKIQNVAEGGAAESKR
jgi:hypothetical protein